MSLFYEYKCYCKRFLVLSAILVGVVAVCWIWREAGVTFDSNAWKQGYVPGQASRLGMARDLTRRHLRVGMAQQEVKLLLGEPSKSEYFSDWDAVYYIGPEEGFFGVDSYWLVIKYADGVVAVASIIRD